MNAYSKKSGSTKMANGGEVGLWERLKAGNVDQEGSKAYNTWGKGAVDESAAETSRLARAPVVKTESAAPASDEGNTPSRSDPAADAADNEAARPKAAPKAAPKRKAAATPSKRVGTEKGRATTAARVGTEKGRKSTPPPAHAPKREQDMPQSERSAKQFERRGDYPGIDLAKKAGSAIKDWFQTAKVYKRPSTTRGPELGMANGGVVGGNKYGKK